MKMLELGNRCGHDSILYLPKMCKLKYRYLRGSEKGKNKNGT